MRGKGKAIRLAGVLLAAVAASGCDYIKDVPVMGRFVAKNVCHDVLVSGYDLAASIDYINNIAPPLKNSWNVQFDAATVQVSVRNLWLSGGTQLAFPAAESPEHACRNQYKNVTPETPSALDVPQLSHSFGDAVGQFPALQALVEQQVAAGAPAHTTAILVLYDNQVVAEAYRDGVGPDSPLKGFSMSKSFANLLVGRLVDKGLLDVQQPLALPQWQNDQRNAIRWHHVLRMNSGLQWHEAAIGKNNQQGMLFYGTSDPAGYAAQQPYEAEPDTVFNYSSGDFMNVATALVDQFPGWFDPGWDLGGPFALEFSPNRRYPLLPEGLSLTTRGWAQMATIYMNDGRLGELQILSPEWVDYSLTPSANNYDYGAGIWLNLGLHLYPNLPTDAFAFLGSYDRFVTAIPSRKAVFVRIGFSSQPGDFDSEGFMQQALALLPGE